MSQQQLTLNHANSTCNWVEQLLAIVFIVWFFGLGLSGNLDLLEGTFIGLLLILFIADLNQGKPSGKPDYKLEVNYQVNLDINHQVNHQINPVVVPVEEVVIDSSAALGFSDSQEYGPAPVIQQRIIELSSLSIRSLKSLASKNKLRRYGNMRKSELIAALI